MVSVLESASQTVANITPVTHLIASRLSATGDPLKLAEELANGTTPITTTSVAQVVADVRAILAPVLAAAGQSEADPLKTPFAADGTGYDQLLDSIQITIIPAGSNANIEIALKSAATEDQSPPVIQFTSNQTVASVTTSNNVTANAIGGTPVGTTTLAATGLAPKIADLLSRMTACYAVPFNERVNGVTNDSVQVVTGTAADVIATACRALFVDNDPASYRHNGAVVSRNANNNGAFAGLFRRGATGVVFSQGTYEFTRSNGDYFIAYRSRDLAGGEQFNVTVVRDVEGTLKLIGNQYMYPGGVSPYHQKRNFITLGQEAYSYYSVGFTPNISNIQTTAGFPLFQKVVVTSPRGVTMTLSPSAGSSFLVFHKSGVPTGTNFIRLRSEFVEGSPAAHPSVRDTTALMYVSADWTDEEIAAIPAQGTWKFEYYLASNPDVIAATQHYKTRARPLTIAELRTRGLASLMPANITDIGQAARPNPDPGTPSRPGQIVIDGVDQEQQISIESETGGDGWSVQAGQLPPTQVAVYGVSPTGVRFNDVVNFSSTTRKTQVPCTTQSMSDNHCMPDSNWFAIGSSINGLHLWASDATGREFANFYAMYLLRPAP